MIRLVLDTNIYISGFLFGGKPSEILRHVESGAIELAYSRPIRVEVEEVLLYKFGWRREMIDLACAPIWAAGIRIKPTRTIRACSDPDDDRILECAVEAAAKCIITGDKHLLTMVRFEGIPILRPDEFLRMVEL